MHLSGSCLSVIKGDETEGENRRVDAKTAILDEFCTTCRCHRKHAIRVIRDRGFKRFTKAKAKRRVNPTAYRNEAIINPLKKIWLAANLPCSKRLKVMLPIWIPGAPVTFFMRHMSTGITFKMSFKFFLTELSW
jgi:hypothetical protein